MKTHWLQSPNKNYLGHWDLPGGKDLTLTIKSAGWEEVENPVLRKDDPKKFQSCKVVRFVEDYKPFICNQINAQSIIKSTGIKYMEDSIGCKINFYVGIHFDRAAKENIDCIRIRNQSAASLPELKINTPEFKKVVAGIKNGFTMDQVKTKYTVSQETEIAILEL
jgi:hypothetical protein